VILVAVSGATGLEGCVVGGGRSEYGVFDRGRGGGSRENGGFRGRATIDSVARLKGLSEGIFGRKRSCDKSGSRVRGVFEKGV
jgi:hypothetical protein